MNSGWGITISERKESGRGAIGRWEMGCEGNGV